MAIESPYHDIELARFGVSHFPLFVALPLWPEHSTWQSRSREKRGTEILVPDYANV